jgi:hypothetical protein
VRRALWSYFKASFKGRMREKKSNRRRGNDKWSGMSGNGEGKSV